MPKHHAFVGCYSGFEPGQLGWVGSDQPGTGILPFVFDSDDGTLTPAGEVIAQASPTWLEPHPKGRFLIATHELSHHTGTPKGVGYVSSYAVQSDGTLQKVCTQHSGGWGNTCATFDRTGRYLLVTRYWEGGISVFPFDPDTGKIGKMTNSKNHDGIGPHPTRQSKPHPHGIHGDPVTDLVYVSDLGTDKVYQYALDTATGSLSARANVPLAPMSGPRGLAFHPTLRVAYVNCELDGTVVVCAIDDAQGLSPVQTALCYPSDFDGQGHPANFGQASFWGAEGCLSAGGAHYYYICRVHQSIAVFDVDPQDGTLRFANRHALVDGSNARNMTLTPEGTHLLVASQDANCVESFRIHPQTGALTLEHRQAAPSAADVAVF